MTSSPAPSPPADAAAERVGVVGLGTMGAGIAEVFARHGHHVVGVEVTDEAVERGRRHLERSTGRAVRRGRLSETEQAELVGRVTLTSTMAEVRDCGLVVEAVVERLEVKQQVFRALDDIVSPDAVLATNTSSLSVTAIAGATAHPGRVVGLHFFNPAPVQGFVEVVRTVVTDPDVVRRASDLAGSLGKTPVVVGDRAGFIANALLFGYLNHAVSMFETGYASREDIDAAMKHGCGYPMGPLALLDLIGLDTAQEILDSMYSQSRDRLHAPAPALRQLVTAGLLGRKSGRGFYAYEGPDSPVVVADALTPAADQRPEAHHDLRTVGVVGTGTRGIGIAGVLTRAGFEVVHVGHDADALEELVDVDLVVEAVGADLAVSSAVFRSLDRICRPGAILATTTSLLPVVALAAATGRARDVVGLHLFDPVPGTRLVEVVSTVSTDPAVAETVRALAVRLGTAAVSCGDRAGAIVDALLVPYLNDAVRMLEAHYATADEIDTAMKHGCALPMGPFEVLDARGLDVSLAVQRRLYRESREPGLAPAPLLEQLVTAGNLGRSSGRGFREHPAR